jgi:hypothetical protein
MRISNHFNTAIILLSLVLLPLYFSSDLCAQQTPIPKFYGMYAVDNGKLIELSEAVRGGRTRLLGHAIGQNCAAGITKLSGISLSKNAEFIFFKDVRPVRIAIAKLKFNKGVTIKGIAPGDKSKDAVSDYFNYLKGEGDPGPADLWMIEESAIPSRLGPIEGRPNMTLVAPSSPLSEGVYMFYAFIPTVSEHLENLLLHSKGGTQATWLCDFVVGSAGVSEGKQESQVQPFESKQSVKSKEQPVKPTLQEPARAQAPDSESKPPTMATVRKAKKAQGLKGVIFQDRNSKKFFLEDSEGTTYKFEGGQWVQIGGQESPVKTADKVRSPEPSPEATKETETSPPTIDTVRKAKKAQGLNGMIFQDRNSGKWFLEDRDDNTYKFEGGQWKKIN